MKVNRVKTSYIEVLDFEANNDHVMHHLSPTLDNVWCDSAGVKENTISQYWQKQRIEDSCGDRRVSSGIEISLFASGAKDTEGKNSWHLIHQLFLEYWLLIDKQ